VSEESGSTSSEAEATATSTALWDRVKHHKVLQWGVAYCGAALALAQAQDLLADAFAWPSLVSKGLLLALVVGLPLVLTAAWYHGHRALRQITGGELAILSILLLIGGMLFTVVVRPDDERALPATVANAAVVPAITETAPALQRPPDSTAARGRSVLPNKVAVLPCANLSPAAGDTHFATGLHRDIVFALDKVRNLNVIPARAVLPYANTNLTIAEIADELDVRALLDCTVRYANERVKITAELIDATGAELLWQDDYEPSVTELADVFAVQADIAKNIANVLSVVLTGEETRLLAKPPTVSTEAYVLMLRAYEQPGFQETIDLLQQAIAADPNYALPRASLAWWEATQLINTNVAAAIAPVARASFEASIREQAERALSLDPAVPLARSALTMLATLNWSWDEAYEHFASTRAVAPNDVMQYDVFLLSYLGRFDEALAVAERAGELLPNELAGALWRGWALGYGGRYDDAAREFAWVVEQRPGTQSLLARDWLTRMELARGNRAAALEHLRLAEQIAGAERQPVFLPMWAYCYGRLGEAADARRIFEEMQASEAAGMRFGVGGWAMAHLAVGNETRALEQLRVAARKAAEREPDEGFFALMALRMNVTNDERLRQPAFAEVLERIKGN
jgi:TolB-like protein/tetratricopeptide (TPR) repeat protein